MDNRIIINKRKQRITITKMTRDGPVPIFWKTMKFWVYGNQNMSQRIIKWIIAQNLIRLGTHLMCYTCLNHLLADSRLKDENATCPNCRCDIGTDLKSHALSVAVARLYQFLYTMHNVIWFGFRKSESRLSRTLSGRIKIVIKKDRTYTVSEPV